MSVLRRGVAYEYILLRKLRSKGFVALRVPKSGRYPYSFDLLAIKNGKVYMIEVKRRMDADRVYVETERVHGVLAQASKAAAVPVLAVNTGDGRGFVFKRLDEWERATERFYVYDLRDAKRGLEEIA